jgi:serine/threonine protein kinase
MSRQRRPAAAPSIAGYEFVRLLGQGGFADVFLYQQNRPRREVAIKVMLAEMVGTDAGERLGEEADLMAGLSQHQNIVTVFHAGVADDGRPYMVMEYYPRPSLATGLREAKHSVASVLEIGVQLAGAVESAHRLGILHRDIKPANILVDRAGRPVLGDFGIAMTITKAQQAAEGLSVPWSPPEAFAAQPWAGPQSDVWGLAATVYSLLTGRAPFEIPGGDNKTHAQADRIRNSPYRPLGRPDAPPALDQVLATAMAKDPNNRYPTMRAFGNALRGVEQEMDLRPTRLDIIDESSGYDPGYDDEDDGGTKLRPITTVDAQSPVTTTGPVAAGPLAQWPTSRDTTGDGPVGPTVPYVWPSAEAAPLRYDPAGTTAQRSLAADGAGSTVLRAEAPEAPRLVAAEEPAGDTDTPPQRKPWAIAAAVGVVVAVAAAVTGVVLWGGEPEPPVLPGPAPSTGGTAVIDPLPDVTVPAPADLAGVIQGQEARFTWTNPDPQTGDFYVWTDVLDPEADRRRVDDPEVAITVAAGETTVCIEVATVRSGRTSEPVRACAAPGEEGPS